jgi:peptide/nickel transport system substrate-binding protein
MKRRSIRVLIPFVAVFTALAAASIGGAGHQNQTLVFGASSDPVILDPILVSDGESLRPIRQMFEGLMTVKAGTSQVIPSLASGYSVSRNGRVYTFRLRRGVRFHDNTQFNAAAVCYNFNRWYNFEGPFQLPNATAYWQAKIGGFKSTVGNANAPVGLRTSLFSSCRAVGRYSARITLTRPSAPFVASLSLPSFSFSSPAALRRYNANSAEVRAGAPVFTGTYGTQHPTGTGPFRFESWRRGDRLTLVRWNRYWGPKAHLSRIILRPISTNAARLQALQTGEV